MVLTRLLRYLKPFQKRFWIAFAALLAATAADVAVPILVSGFIDGYLVKGRFDLAILSVFGGVLAALLILSAALHYYQMLTFQTIAQWVVRKLRQDVFGKVQHLALSFFDRTPAGALVSRITNDTEAVKELFIYVLSSFLQNTVFILAVVAGMFKIGRAHV